MSVRTRRQLFTEDMPPSKRQKTISNARRSVVPEVKELILPISVAQVNNGTVSVTLVTQITQGTGGNQRIGNRCKLLSIEMTGRLAGLGADASALLVVPKNSILSPDLANFSDGVAPCYDADRGWTIMGFTPGSKGANTLIDYGDKVYTFTNGMHVQFDGGNPVKNAVFLCIVNRTGTNVTGISGNIRMRFTDA
jgi:hypothetical protein